MKKILMLLMCLILLCSSITVYADTPSDWAIDFIDELEELNIIGDHFFNNYKSPMTRQEAAYLLVKLYEMMNGYISIPEGMVLDDTEDTYALKAVAANIASGVGNNKFAPDDFVTRQEFATLLVKTLEISGHVLYEGIYRYKDEYTISDWAKSYIHKATEHNLLSGIGDDLFSPVFTITKEEGLTIVLKTFNNYIARPGYGYNEISWDELNIDAEEQHMLGVISKYISGQDEFDVLLTEIIQRESSGFGNVISLVLSNMGDGLTGAFKTIVASDIKTANIYKEVISKIHDEAIEDNILLDTITNSFDIFMTSVGIAEDVNDLYKVTDLTDMLGQSKNPKLGGYLDDLFKAKGIFEISKDGLAIFTTQHKFEEFFIDELLTMEGYDEVYSQMIKEYQGLSYDYVTGNFLFNFGFEVVGGKFKPNVVKAADAVASIGAELSNMFLKAEDKRNAFILTSFYAELNGNYRSAIQGAKNTPSPLKYKTLRDTFYMRKHTKMALIQSILEFPCYVESNMMPNDRQRLLNEKAMLEKEYERVKIEGLEEFYDDLTTHNNGLVRITHVDKENELITIKNGNAFDVDISGWQVTSERDQSPYVIGHYELGSGKSITIGMSTSNPTISWGTEKRLNNQDRDNCMLIDLDKSFTYTYEDTHYYHQGDVKIISLDKVKEVVTIKNSGVVKVNLEDWTINSSRDEDYFTIGKYSIQPDETLTIGRDGSGATITWGTDYKFNNELQDDVVLSDLSMSFIFRDNKITQPGDIQIISLDKSKEQAILKNKGVTRVSLKDWTFYSERDEFPFVIGDYKLNPGETISIGREGSDSTIIWGDEYRFNNERQDSASLGDPVRGFTVTYRDQAYYKEGDIVIVSIDKRKELVYVKNKGQGIVNLQNWLISSDRDEESFVLIKYHIKPGETITIGMESSNPTISWGAQYRLNNDTQDNCYLTDENNYKFTYTDN